MSLDSERSTLKTVAVDGKDSLTELRALRKKARSISRHLRDDLLPFRHADGTYAVHPPKAKAITAPISTAQEAGGAAQPSSIAAPSNQEITPPANVHVTTTCTVLMTLITAHELASVLGEEKEREEALRIQRREALLPRLDKSRRDVRPLDVAIRAASAELARFIVRTGIRLLFP